MSAWKLSARSIQRMQFLHPDLIRVVMRASLICPQEFMVLEGIRSAARQELMVQKKASTTLNSRHLMRPCMVNGRKVHHGHAVDLGAMIGTKVDWTWELYEEMAKWVKMAAKEEGVPIEWGGDWVKLRDGPHYQLPWKEYPILEG